MDIKRIIALILVVVLVLGIIFMAAGCGKKEPEGSFTVSITDTVVHTAPAGYTEDDLIVLTGGEGFDRILERVVGYTPEYQHLPYYDKNGENVGTYVIDKNGWIAAWKDEDGKVHKLPTDEQFEASIDDLIPVPFELAGTVELMFLLYTKEGVPAACYQYFIFSDSADSDKSIQALKMMNVPGAEKVADNVLLQVVSGAEIDEALTLEGNVSVAEYIKYLQTQFGTTLQSSNDGPAEDATQEPTEDVGFGFDPIPIPTTGDSTETGAEESTGETTEETTEGTTSQQ